MSTRQFTELEQAIEYHFNDPKLLKEALSHPSLKQHAGKHQPLKNYERLELLGDSILNFIITEFLFKSFVNHTEGRLAKIRAYLVSKEVICKVAAKISLSTYIIMTHGEEVSGGRYNPNNIENTMEALIAAIYLDSSIKKVQAIVYNLWYEFIPTTSNLSHYDPKTALQEWAQSKGYNKPVYEIINKEGAAHSGIFTVQVKIANYMHSGKAQSVKEAEKDAARKLLSDLKLL